MLASESEQETVLTFLVPTPHPDNVVDWGSTRAVLSQTMASVAAQTDPRWRGIVVANHGADLPPLPAGFEALRVDFPPNPHRDIRTVDYEVFCESLRADKGRRLLAGLLHAPSSRFCLVVDDDDFVSNRLVAFVASHPEANGWYVDRGYVWGSGQRMIFRFDGFNDHCGTSLIVRRDLYRAPASLEAAPPRFAEDMLGSHRRIRGILEARGEPLAALPFRGAVYRVGHRGSTTRTPAALEFFFRVHAANAGLRQRFEALARRGADFRWPTSRIRREFFAGAAPG